MYPGSSWAAFGQISAEDMNRKEYSGLFADKTNGNLEPQLAK
jgi:hypothetical protein